MGPKHSEREEECGDSIREIARRFQQDGQRYAARSNSLQASEG